MKSVVLVQIGLLLLCPPPPPIIVTDHYLLSEGQGCHSLLLNFCGQACEGHSRSARHPLQLLDQLLDGRIHSKVIGQNF